MKSTPLRSGEHKVAMRQHVAYLDGIRALSALFVVLHHCFVHVNFQAAPIPRWMGACLSILGFGHYAVDVFIVLSGFCLALPVVKGDGHMIGGALKFFQKRARRILPPYFLALAFSFLLIHFEIGQKTGTHWDVSLPVDQKSIITHLFLVQDIFSDTSSKINHAFWSISVEWRIYFLFSLLIAIRRRWNSSLAVVASIAVSYFIIHINHHIPLFSSFSGVDVFGAAPQYLCLFTMGLLGADVAYGKTPSLYFLRRPASALSVLGVSTVTIILVSEVRLWHGEIMAVPFADFFVGAWATSLMVAAANSKVAWLNKFLSWRPLVAIGTFAYSIYLIHGPLIQVIWQYVLFPLQHNPLPMFLALCTIGMPLMIGFSYLFFLVCERPFLTTRKRETFAETERDAALAPAP